MSQDLIGMCECLLVSAHSTHWCVIIVTNRQQFGKRFRQNNYHGQYQGINILALTTIQTNMIMAIDVAVKHVPKHMYAYVLIKRIYCSQSKQSSYLVLCFCPKICWLDLGMKYLLLLFLLSWKVISSAFKKFLELFILIKLYNYPIDIGLERTLALM